VQPDIAKKSKPQRRALKVNENSVFFAKVGKDGQAILKPNASNMMTVPVETLNNGIYIAAHHAGVSRLETVTRLVRLLE
jgi:hypothetical protein